MLKPQLRLKALPLVASMLGDKLGVKVVFGEQDTACTDGATVFLPLPAPSQEDASSRSPMVALSPTRRGL